MLLPERVKYRMQHRGRMRGKAYRGSTVSFGDYGIKALEPHRVTARQIEACRLVITQRVSETGRFWIRIFPDVPVSNKPAEVRMGREKGNVEYYICRVKPGKIMFELDGVTPELAREALDLAAMKLPVKTKFVSRIGAEKEAA